MNRQPHRFVRRRGWLLAGLLIVLLAGHGAILYYVSSHAMLSTAALSAAVILVVIKHAGLLGPVWALFRRRRARRGL